MSDHLVGLPGEIRPHHIAGVSAARYARGLSGDYSRCL